MKDILIVHPMDPLGNRIGGVATFLRGFIKHCPSDYEIRWIGVTTDPKRPLNQWQEITLCSRKVKFFAAFYLHDENRQTFIPLSVKFAFRFLNTAGIISSSSTHWIFQRMESVLPFLRRLGQKSVFIHGDMRDIKNPVTGMRWKYFPWLYFLFEKLVMRYLDNIFCVRFDAVKSYKKKYPKFSNRFYFFRTWIDHDVFSPTARAEESKTIRSLYGLKRDDKVIIFVGRLDGEKDPKLLIEAFNYVQSRESTARLIIVGTGSLENEMKEYVRHLRIEEKVVFTGPLPQEKVADLLRTSDVFVLTSGYEGMPMSVLEALACGVPVVTPNVGEVSRVVSDGVSGVLVKNRTPQSIGEAVLEVLKNKSVYLSQNCISSVREYDASKILLPIFNVINRT